MEKSDIIEAIKATAPGDGSKPLGAQRFEKETGIKEHDWRGRFWTSWGEALTEAGYSPNKFNEAYDADWLIEQFAKIVQELGEWPTVAKLRMYCRDRDELPEGKTFSKRLGNKREMAARVLAFCRERGGYDDVASICEAIAAEENTPTEEENNSAGFGFVYLMKFGKYHKIGRSNSVGRREYELGTKLPEELTTIHTIKTDDPPGVEAYWHNRFAEKRREGEWFSLNAADVRAFKKWRRIF